MTWNPHKPNIPAMSGTWHVPTYQIPKLYTSMVDSDPLNIKLLLESWKPRHASRCGVVPYILLRYHEASFIVTGWAGVSIHRHLLTLHGGEVLAAHPRIKVENLKFLQTFRSAFKLQKCTIAYYVISSRKNFWMKQPVSQYKLKFCNPRCQVPMLRICCPPWGVSPAVTLVPQTSELPGPQKMQIQSWSQKPWTFVPRKRAKNWKTMSA